MPHGSQAGVRFVLEAVLMGLRTGLSRLCVPSTIFVLVHTSTIILVLPNKGNRRRQ